MVVGLVMMRRDIMPHPKLDICKRGHSPERRNKHGQCRDCANLVRRKGKTYPLHCQRGHEWIPGQRRCLLCQTEKSKERRSADPERFKKNHSSWVANNRERARELCNKSCKKAVATLNDSYVTTRIGIKDAPPELIEVVRLNITLKRETKSWKSKQ